MVTKKVLYLPLGDFGVGSLGLYQSGEPTAHTQVASSSPPSVPTAPAYKTTSSVDGGSGIFNKVSLSTKILFFLNVFQMFTNYFGAEDYSQCYVYSGVGTCSSCLWLFHSRNWHWPMKPKRSSNWFGIMFGVICELKGTQFHPHILPCELWTQPNKSSNRTTSQFGVLCELE